MAARVEGTLGEGTTFEAYFTCVQSETMVCSLASEIFPNGATQEIDARLPTCTSQRKPDRAVTCQSSRVIS